MPFRVSGRPRGADAGAGDQPGGGQPDAMNGPSPVGFAEPRFGDAAAVAMLLFAVTLVVAAVQLFLLRRWLRWENA